MIIHTEQHDGNILSRKKKHIIKSYIQPRICQKISHVLNKFICNMMNPNIENVVFNNNLPIGLSPVGTSCDYY